MREFDLNIERVLENWTVAHALRATRRPWGVWEPAGGGRTVWRILWTWPTSGLPSTRTG